MTIDWNAEIEDWHGRPMLLRYTGIGGRSVKYATDSCISWLYSEDGEPVGNGPRIRNVRPKPETPAQTYDPALVERMVGLVREVAKGPGSGDGLSQVYVDTARAIANLLPEPVDADLVEAREIAISNTIIGTHDEIESAFRSGEYDERRAVKIARDALRRGRELEREGK